MRTIFAVLVAAALTGTSAYAAGTANSQDRNANAAAALSTTTSNAANEPANTGAANQNAPSNPAVKTNQTANNAGAPAAGANSFTEGEAKARIEARGYGNVTGLTKDANGLWRGKAMQNGKTVNVTLDYQGNVVTE